MIPSGYKNQKVYSAVPTDGLGDLSFSRASSATRVASNGLIEKVRTNLFTYSEQFDNASWLKTRATITANATTSPDGTSTADKMIANTENNSHFIDQPITTPINIPFTFSVFAKAGEYEFLQINNQADNSIANFNLSNGTLGTISGYEASITNAGNGWYRCVATRTFTSVPTTHRVALITSSTSARLEAFIGDGTSGLFLWGAQTETGDIATDYIATTTAAVSVGPVSGLPRLDYLGSTCGRLILEPQRTNLQTFSENIDNAVYVKSNVTISANATTSPDGYSNADKIVEDTTNAVHRISGFGGVMASATTYTSSFFAKKAERDQVYILIPTSVAATRTVVVFNLTTGVSSVASGSSATSHSMVDYGSGWYRCIVTFTTTAVGTNLIGIYNGAEDYAGTTSFGLFLYGLMNEAGAYATSYIPTLGASVTRNPDIASKTGISSLYGATEGVVYLETGVCFNNDDTSPTKSFIRVEKDANNWFGISSGGSNAAPAIRFVTNIAGVVTTEGSPAGLSNSKIAFLYTASSIKIYQNGALVLTVNKSIGNYASVSFMVNSLDDMTMPLKQFLIFPTALTDAQAIELTA
jgi:hypothetical protein